jgi:hypothetical protein
LDDSTIQDQIEKLVAEEEELRRGHEGEGEDPERHKRLQQVKVELDRAWDLLRQRRAAEEFGQDPDDASERDADVVEGYEQ